jgi:hypothetical protein
MDNKPTTAEEEKNLVEVILRKLFPEGNSDGITWEAVDTGEGGNDFFLKGKENGPYVCVETYGYHDVKENQGANILLKQLAPPHEAYEFRVTDSLFSPSTRVNWKSSFGTALEIFQNTSLIEGFLLWIQKGAIQVETFHDLEPDPFKKPTV